MDPSGWGLHSGIPSRNSASLFLDSCPAVQCSGHQGQGAQRLTGLDACPCSALPGALQMQKCLRGHFWADCRVTVSAVISRGQQTRPSAYLPDLGVGGDWSIPERKNLAPRFPTGDFPWRTSGGPPTPLPHYSPSPGPRPRTPFHSAVGMTSNISWCWEPAPR